MDETLNELNNSELPDDWKEQLAKIYDKYQQLDDEEKETLNNDIKKMLNFSPHNSILPTWLGPYESYIFFFAVSIVFFLLGTVLVAFQIIFANLCESYCVSVMTRVSSDISRIVT